MLLLSTNRRYHNDSPKSPHVITYKGFRERQFNNWRHIWSRSVGYTGFEPHRLSRVFLSVTETFFPQLPIIIIYVIIFTRLSYSCAKSLRTRRLQVEIFGHKVVSLCTIFSRRESECPRTGCSTLPLIL